jgi:hypothetical protein
LEELIIVAMADKDTDSHRLVVDERPSALTPAKKWIKAGIERRMREQPDLRLPIVRVMTDKELETSMGVKRFGGMCAGI